MELALTRPQLAFGLCSNAAPANAHTLKKVVRNGPNHAGEPVVAVERAVGSKVCWERHKYTSIAPVPVQSAHTS